MTRTVSCAFFLVLGAGCAPRGLGPEEPGLPGNPAPGGTSPGNPTAAVPHGCEGLSLIERRDQSLWVIDATGAERELYRPSAELGEGEPILSRWRARNGFVAASGGIYFEGGGISLENVLLGIDGTAHFRDLRPH